MSITHETGAKQVYATINATTASEQNELMWDKYQQGAAYNYKSTRPYHETNGYGYWFNGNSGSITYTLGLTPSLYGYTGNRGASWFTTSNIDVSSYVGSTSRVVCIYTSGTGFRGDAQIGWVRLGGTTWTFESGPESWETTALNSTTITYANASFFAVATGPGTTPNTWNRHSGGTGSSSTGLVGNNTIYGSGTAGTWYLYAETSGSGYSNKDFLCRSPAVSVSSNTLELVLAGYGSQIGTFDVHLDVVS